LYATNNDPAYIQNTVISGSVFRPAITIYSWLGTYGVDNIVTVDGFTIMNNEEGVIVFNNVSGGGISIEGGYTTIKNNIIKNNLASLGGGGIHVSGHSRLSGSFLETIVTLENNQIYDNLALYRGGGGFATLYVVDFTFCRTNRNSIFDNRAPYALDILLFHNYENVDVSIYLDRGSRILTGIDNYFIDFFYQWAIGKIYYPMFYLNILRETQPPFINNDLYVAPWGDDNNSGLSFDSAFKTIDRAARSITNAPFNPNTIYLAPGTYSPSLNDQIFPFSLPGNVSLIGAGAGETIIQGDNFPVMFGSANPNPNKDVSNTIGNMTIKGFSTSARYVYGTIALSGASFRLENMIFEDNDLPSIAFFADSAERVSLDNVVIRNSRGGAFISEYTDNIYIM
jgi:hypothetical protein